MAIKIRRSRRATRKSSRSSRTGGYTPQNSNIRYKATDVLDALGLQLTGIITLEMFFRMAGIPLSHDGYVKREDVRRSFQNRGLGDRFDPLDAMLNRY